MFTKPENAKTCATEVEALFRSTILEVKCHKLPYEAVKDHLNGQELANIEEIMEGVPEEV
jgi:hypothetical protein